MGEGYEDFHKDHPYGHTLLSRDNDANRKLFPDGSFGYADVAESSCSVTGECPYYHYTVDRSGNQAMDAPIHILIAAFRDQLCARTIHNAFSHAANPKRVFLRIIDQTQPNSELVDDQGCWPRYCSEYNENCDEYKSQVRSVRVDSAQSKGPTWARSKLSAMIHWDYVHRDEPEEIVLEPVQSQDFCMQIDSHMDFSDNYDQGLIAMHHRTENDYAVLSTYVTDIEQNNQDPKTVPNLCMVTFTSSIRNWGTKECRGLQKPKLTNAMWGAGLSFHRCHAEVNVPVDPYLDGVFDGEEGSRGIRFFTHGYDVYTPDKVLVTHDYHGHQSNPVVHTWGRGGRKQKAGEDEGEKAVQDAVFEEDWKWMAEIESKRDQWHTFGTKRVNMLLSIGSHFNSTEKEAGEVEKMRHSRFGLGTKRTLEQVRDFTGINLLEEKMESIKCGNLNWVPFEKSLEYGIEETLERALGAQDVVLVSHSEKVAAALQDIKTPVKMLRSLSNNKNTGSVNSSGGEAANAEGTMDIRITGGIILAVLVVVRWSAQKLRPKDRRHHD
jgi:hypothetical protein